jgi:hypothetical protein
MLDEHLGIEGLESQAGDPEIANETRSFLEQKGFRVFGGTYSQEMWSAYSLARLFNFDGRSAEAVIDTTGRFQHELTRNRYFDRLVEAGYALHVLQTSFVNLCPPSLSAVCRTYDIRKLNTAEFGRLPLPFRLDVLSFFLASQSAVWRDVRRTVDTRWGPPGDETVLVSTLSAMELMNDLIARLGAARNGEAYFAHVMLPHYPYVYDRDCRVRPLEDWLDRLDSTLPDRLANTDEGRRRRYALYVDQMRCVQKRLDQALDAIPNDVAPNAIVIVHGDHGSRIFARDPAQKIAKASDYISAFSTLFAVRAPGVATGYQSDQVSLSCLFQHFIDAGFQSPQELSSCGPAEPVFSIESSPLGTMPPLGAGS